MYIEGKYWNPCLEKTAPCMEKTVVREQITCHRFENDLLL